MYVSTSSGSRNNLLRAIRFEKPEYIPMTFHINAPAGITMTRMPFWI